MSTYSLGTIHITKKTHRYLEQVLQSKRLSYGPFCRKFEEKFADLHQSRFAILCSSGTAALQTILTALKITHRWPEKSEVIVPSVTFVATLNAVIQAGLTPVLVDVEEENYNLDPKLIKQKIGHKTKAVMPVHLFGKPAKMRAIKQLATDHSLLLIEDCCETVAAKYAQKSVGSWSEAAAFSSNSAHILATGIGGIITTNNQELEQLMRSLINHGRRPSYLSIDDDDELDSAEFEKIIEDRFRFDQVGFSYRLSEFEAAVGLSQLEDLPHLIKKRVDNVTYLNQQLQPLKTYLQLPQIQTDSHVFMAYPLVLTKKALRGQSNLLADLVLYLEKNGIETRPLMPVIDQPAYRQYKFKLKDYPVASSLLKSGFYVGCHQDLTKKDLDNLVTKLTDFFSKRSLAK